MPRNDLIQVRSDTSSNWTSVNPILATGEIGFESNTGKFKIGTGSTAWSSLPYTSDTAGLATTADAWTNARTITLAGDLTGSVSINGSANVSLSATIAANSVALGTDTTGNYMSGITGTSPVTVSHTAGQGSSASVSLASGYGDTLNPYASKTAKYFLAAPNGTSGVPTFRAIVKSDIPTLDQDTSGSAGSVPASGITGQTGMWTSAIRPGPYRLYRRDDNSDYSVQTYYENSRWRLYGYNGNTAHADTHVGYADRATTADSWTTERTISLTGDVTGSDTISGSGNISINATIGTGKVTTDEILNNTIVNGDISTTAAIALSKLATTGTLTADFLVGNGTYISGLYANALTSGTVPSARISGSYNGITDVGTLTSGLTISSGDVIINGAGNEFCSNPSTGSGTTATWVFVSPNYRLYRFSSTISDKENIQSVGTLLNPDMIDEIDVQLWNRKTAPGIPEVGPMAEDMDAISPFLSTRGLEWDENGSPIPSPIDGINNNSWMSLLTIGMQDIRQRLAKLENPDV